MLQEVEPLILVAVQDIRLRKLRVQMDDYAYQ